MSDARQLVPESVSALSPEGIEAAARALYEARGKPTGKWVDRGEIRKWVNVEWDELDSAHRWEYEQDAQTALSSVPMVPREEHEMALARAEGAETVVDELHAERDAARAEADRLREAIEEYRLWEPGRVGHAEAQRKLFATLDGDA